MSGASDESLFVRDFFARTRPNAGLSASREPVGQIVFRGAIVAFSLLSGTEVFDPGDIEPGTAAARVAYATGHALCVYGEHSPHPGAGSPRGLPNNVRLFRRFPIDHFLNWRVSYEL